jgi:3-oxoacyl-[acyl-carrier protein] reductase
MGTIFITGASGGLGVPVTRRFLQDGWALHAAVHHREAADQLIRQFPGYPIQASVVDITRRDEVEGWIDAVTDMDGLVHLAGGFRGGNELAASSDADYEFLFNLHARATFYLLAAVMPRLKQRGGGAIVTVAARTALRPGKEAALYAASKAAELTLTLAAAEEGRPYQVRANCIVPAVIRTPANMEGAPEKEIAKWTDPADIAECIVFLVSDRGRSVSGALIPMYGGIPA